MKVTEITPLKFQCIAGLACPSVFRTDTGSLVIVGKLLKILPPEVAAKLTGPVEEAAVEIPAEMIALLGLGSDKKA